MNNNRGFTLIEIMVVVVIAAILMGAVAISFPDSSDDRLKEEGARFVALVSLAQDDAILQSGDFALSTNDAGYSFFMRDGGSWRKYSDKPFNSRQLSADIQAQMVLEGIAIKLVKAEKAKPQVVIYSSGEMTPFVYTLTNTENSSVTMRFDGAGNLKKTFKSNEK